MSGSSSQFRTLTGQLHEAGVAPQPAPALFIFLQAEWSADYRCVSSPRLEHEGRPAKRIHLANLHWALPTPATDDPNRTRVRSRFCLSSVPQGRGCDAFASTSAANAPDACMRRRGVIVSLPICATSIQHWVPDFGQRHAWRRGRWMNSQRPAGELYIAGSFA